MRKLLARTTILTVASIFLLSFVFLGFGSSAFFASSAASSSNYPACNNNAVQRPVFVWMFGYVGDVFYPQTNNSLSPSQMISAAQSISSSVGKANLRLVGSVDVEQGHNVQPAYVSQIASYVSSLEQYASVVYGRIDMEQFPNYTALSTETNLFVNELHLNGIFFDLAPPIYHNNPTKFNAMMQELTENYPNVCYLFNQTAPSITITPGSGDTWQNNAYVSPTVAPGSLTTLAGGLTKVQDLNELYPGHVIIHYDANAGLGNTEPMAYFANAAASKEEAAVQTLASQGYNYYKSKNTGDEFNFLFPVFGAWSSHSSSYKGTLYNGLTTGTYSRSTMSTFVSTMVKYP
jgi:hypothetical protein